MSVRSFYFPILTFCLLFFVRGTVFAQYDNVSVFELYRMQQEEEKLNKATVKGGNTDPKRGILLDENKFYGNKPVANGTASTKDDPSRFVPIETFNSRTSTIPPEGILSFESELEYPGGFTEEIVPGDRIFADVPLPPQGGMQRMMNRPQNIVPAMGPSPRVAQTEMEYHDPYAHSGNTIPIPNEFRSEGFEDYAQTNHGEYDRNAPPQFGMEMLNLRNVPGFASFAHENNRLDARLNGLCFVNRYVGWAVGDLGVIWHTRNGGKSWVMQKSPVKDSLKSVDFLDEKHGIIVGGSIQSHTHLGKGVVLFTKDGGQNWEKIENENLPILNHVRITSPGTGWSIGLGTNPGSSGLYAFSKDCTVWTPIDGPRSEGLISADFYGNIGCGIEVDGAVRMLGNLQREKTVLPHIGLKRPQSLALFSVPAPGTGIHGWMVGDGGLLLYTMNAGIRWQAIKQPVHPKVSELFDLKTIFAHGKNAWIAGSPGTLIFRTSDTGTSWEPVLSGTTATIRKITFVNSKIGFAVGDFGTILATEDGGRSWTVQREGGRRLSYLVLAARAEDVPFEAIAKLSGEEGYFGGVQLLMRDELAKSDISEISLETRLHEAVVRCGGSGAWNSWAFPIDPNEVRVPIEKLVDRLNRENNEKGLIMFRESLIRAIRQHRPNVILIPDPGMRKTNPARNFISRELLYAIRDAADSTVFPEHIHDCKLAPWAVQRALLCLNDGVMGEINIQTVAVMPKLGKTLDVAASEARGVVFKERMISHKSVGFQTEYDRLPPRGERDFFTGINIQPGSEARRNRMNPPLNINEALQKELALRLSMKASFESVLDHPHEETRTRLVSTALELANAMERETAVEALLELAERCRDIGEYSISREIETAITVSFSSEPNASEAFPRLIRQLVSRELTDLEFSQPNGRDVVFSRLEHALRLGKSLQMLNPVLEKDSRLQYLLATAQRELTGNSIEPFTSLSAMYSGTLWSKRAQAELWLARFSQQNDPPEQNCPIGSISVPYTETRPYIDGLCEEEAWLDCGTPTFLSHLPGDTGPAVSAKGSLLLGTQVMFMHDEEYLYIAARAPKNPEFTYKEDNGAPRSRDADISNEDRIEFLFDLDRDYSSFYRFSVDHRGWATEYCGNDKQWDPGIVIARSSDENFWTIELAIEKRTINKIQDEEIPVWGVGIRRIVPGLGIECWNEESALGLDEGFGLMLFE